MRVSVLVNANAFVMQTRVITVPDDLDLDAALAYAESQALREAMSYPWSVEIGGDTVDPPSIYVVESAVADECEIDAAPILPIPDEEQKP